MNTPGIHEARRGFGARDLRTGILFAALMLAVSAGARLAARAGVAGADAFGDRAHMALIGAFIAWMGNTIPKRLTPLDRLRCDPARAQAFFRLAGWIWVLAGLAMIGAWLALPLDVAGFVTLTVVPAAMLLVAWRWTGLGGAPPKAV